jgi:hypothetical protein
VSDLERTFKELKAKQGRYQILNDYYDGRHSLQYATERLQSQFKDLKARWTENWCCVVVDSLLDRLSLKGFKLDDEAASSALEKLWDSIDLSLDSDTVNHDVAVTSEGFIMVERAEDGAVNAFANPPHLCHAHYSEDNPREMEFASKWFDKDNHAHLTLYYPDHLVHYTAEKPRAEVTEAKAFMLDPEFDNGEEPNEYGRIPMFHYRGASKGGELPNVVGPQNAINKLFADMMVSAEYGAWPQRWALVNSSTDTTGLKASPNTIMKIPFDAESGGQGTAVGQFDATQLENFYKAMDREASVIAVITRTPKHYLLQQQGEVSGEALIAMEAPLNRKAGKYTARLGVTWRQCAQFILELLGYTVAANDIEPIWEDVRTVQPLTESEIRWNNQRAGIPVEVQLEDEGWTDEQIARIGDAETASQTRTTTIADVAIEEARRRAAAGQVAGAPNATVAE